MKPIKLPLRGVNVTGKILRANVRSAIRRGLVQAKPHDPNHQRICLIGGGPSLNDTIDELREQVFEGHKLVAINNTYNWLIEHNFRPSVVVVMDARAFNSRFIEKNIPGCQYFLASQCAPETFDIVEDRQAYIFHCMCDIGEKKILDRFYNKRYYGVPGGSTVTLRAIMLMRMLGFQKMDIYGFDSCWLEKKHHAYEQKENDGDHHFRVWSIPHDDTGPREDLKVQFTCAPWMMKQYEDFLSLVKHKGHLFDLNIHGDGLIAHAVRTGAKLRMEETNERGTQDQDDDKARKCAGRAGSRQTKTQALPVSPA